MATTTDKFLSGPIENLISYVLTDFDDYIFNELVSDSIPNAELSEDLKRKTISRLNPIAKKALLSPFSSEAPSLNRRLIGIIHQIYEKANALSLKKIQMHYAHQLNIDLQEVKNIYLAVSTHCPTANKPSVIETKTSLPTNRPIIINPELKKTLADGINRNFDKIKALDLEKIQTYFANQLKIDLQDIKITYLATSAHNLTTLREPNSPKKLNELDLSLKISHTNTVVIISPKTKNNLVKNINDLFCTTEASLEKIQAYYANQLKIDLQDIKNIYLAVSIHCPSAHEVSEIKQRNLNNLIYSKN
jgi:hypothetical protein